MSFDEPPRDIRLIKSSRAFGIFGFRGLFVGREHWCGNLERPSALLPLQVSVIFLLENPPCTFLYFFFFSSCVLQHCIVTYPSPFHCYTMPLPPFFGYGERGQHIIIIIISVILAYCYYLAWHVERRFGIWLLDFGWWLVPIVLDTSRNEIPSSHTCGYLPLRGL